MSVTQQLTVLMLMVAMMTKLTEAVTCYKCISMSDSRCSSDSYVGSMAKCSGTSCYTFNGTVGGTSTFIRDCLPTASLNKCEYVDKDIGAGIVKGTYCFCGTNYCNGDSDGDGVGGGGGDGGDDGDGSGINGAIKTTSAWSAGLLMSTTAVLAAAARLL
jgi:hypothetical protein